MGYARRQPPNTVHSLGMDELGLQELLLGNILSNDGSSYNLARCIFDGRNSQGNIDIPAILGYPDSLETLYSLSLLKLL